MAIAIYDRYAGMSDAFPENFPERPLELRVDGNSWVFETPEDVLNKLYKVLNVDHDTFRCSTKRDIAVHTRDENGTRTEYFSRNELGSIPYIERSAVSAILPLKTQLHRVRGYFSELDNAYAHIPSLSVTHIHRILERKIGLYPCDDIDKLGQGVTPNACGGYDIAVIYRQPLPLLAETLLHELMHLHVFEQTGDWGMDGKEYPVIAFGERNFRIHQWLHYQATKTLNDEPYILAYSLHALRARTEFRPWLREHALPALRSSPIDLEQLFAEALPFFNTARKTRE
jgi:hypothetical protein